MSAGIAGGRGMLGVECGATMTLREEGGWNALAVGSSIDGFGG